MKVIEMRVRHQDQIDGWKIGNAQTRTPETLQNEQPARKIGIDDDALSADLHEKAGMANERNAKFSISRQARLMRLTATPGYGRMPHQT